MANLLSVDAFIEAKLVHGGVTNIPAEFHSADLRNYFSQFIEEKGFSCFHFRHRPEGRRKDDDSSNGSKTFLGFGQLATNVDELQSTQSQEQSHSRITDSHSCITDNKKTCCVVRLTEPNMTKFLKMYHKKPWVDRKGEIMAERCIILRIRVSEDAELLEVEAGPEAKYQTRLEQRTIPSDREVFTHSDLMKLAELQPPDTMPNGNVGTPTSVFLQLIRECRLPPKMIKKLGLTFPRNRSNKRYGNVPFNYGGNVIEGGDESEFVTTGAGHDISSAAQGEENVGKNTGRQSSETKSRPKYGRTKQQSEFNKTETKMEREDKEESESGEDDDDDTCEEWERHEALHDDVTKQERTEERLFESEMEVTWDKGSSGLVFYTDAAYWKELQGDFDEQTADDWDVDMSAYYDPDGGDKDARDLIQMRREHRRRQGLETESFFSGSVGKFEKHTKGVGRRVLERQGWKEGQGIGKNASGMAEALDNEGQTSRDKKGLGYYGEKLRHEPGSSSRKRRADREVIISTIYDNPEDNDPTEPLLRSQGPYHLKYRDEVKFRKADDR